MKGVPVLPKLVDNGGDLDARRKHFRALREWREQVKRDFMNVSIESFPQAQVDRLFSAFDIDKSGISLVRGWRWNQFCQGNPVRRTLPKELPEYYLAEYSTRYHEHRGTILSVPVSVIYEHILPHVGYRNVFTLMQTCKQFQSISHRFLMMYAQMFFNHPNATPLALSAWTFLDDLITVPKRSWFKKNFHIERFPERNYNILIQKVIKRYHLVDNLRQIDLLKESNRLAAERENAFILGVSASRFAEMKEKFEPIGFPVALLQSDVDFLRRYDECFIVDIGTESGYMYLFRQVVQDYIHVKSDYMFEVDIKYFKMIFDLIRDYPAITQKFPILDARTCIFIWIFALCPDMRPFIDSWSRSQFTIPHGVRSSSVYWSLSECSLLHGFVGEPYELMQFDHPILQKLTARFGLSIYKSQESRPEKRIKLD